MAMYWVSSRAYDYITGTIFLPLYAITIYLFIYLCIYCREEKVYYELVYGDLSFLHTCSISDNSQTIQEHQHKIQEQSLITDGSQVDLEMIVH